MSEKFDEEVAVFFAKEFAFSFGSVKGLLDFFDELREFSHHLSENHYYSENINKRIMALNLEVHSLALELAKIDAEASKFHASAEAGLMAGKSPVINKLEFEALRANLENNYKKVIELNDSLQKLVRDVKQEYNGKV